MYAGCLTKVLEASYSMKNHGIVGRSDYSAARIRAVEGVDRSHQYGIEGVRGVLPHQRNLLRPLHHEYLYGNGVLFVHSHGPDWDRILLLFHCGRHRRRIVHVAGCREIGR